jgi:hypothetical protein
MRVDTDDLIRVFQGNGDAFEDFVHDLVRAVCRSCAIDPIYIDWDYRTNVKDGGRDLLVRVPNQRAEKRFIPLRPSVWSIKSGEDGVRPATLKDELLAGNHPKVRQALMDGWAYVWCTIHPANQDRRDDMRRAADEVADQLRVDRGLIEFRWPEHLQGEVNLHPNLIPLHLQDVALPLTEVLSLGQWGRELELGGGWVEFGGRGDVVRRVAEHLLGKKPPNVLHIAGLSGTGKTRTVFEACSREPELKGVFYIEQFERVGRPLYRYLEEEGRRVYLVIDETPLIQVDAIASRLGEFADRLRVVTIGPAVRQAAISRDDTIVLPEPDTDAGVFEVIRSAGPSLSEEVLRSIASQSAHDLRLALLLVHASQRLPEFRGTTVVGIDGVWQRLMGLFAAEIGNPHEFRRFYEVLTASIDVGMADDVDGEILALAQHFHHPVEHLRETTVTSVRCGLGIRTQRFFEAAPQALAARLFAERVWPRIRDVLEDFIVALPDRLGRRFLERCQDCAGPVREEVMARLGDFFLKALAGENVTVLASREASRLFQAWAEFDPGRGLAWLRRAVEVAAPEQLRALDGEPDYSGGWRGRRQLVWLCQNLASFAEHFEDCEATLFRLALHETESSIANNSTAIWQSLFWPVLAGTELPFERRLPILLRRLRTATTQELPLVFSAAVGCVEHRQLGLPAPPRVVGGRIVPRPWRPRTWGEILNLRRDAGRQILDVVAELPGGCSEVALVAVAEHQQAFTGLGLLDHLRTLFRPELVSESIRRHLVIGLEKQIAFLSEGGRQDRDVSTLRPLEEWLADLSPSDLASRVRDLTVQSSWPIWGRKEREDRSDRLADELIGRPETFHELADWFDSPEARSADSLAFRLGRRDDEGRLAGVVRDWLRADRCRTVVISYLNGVAARESTLPEEWAAVLDALAANHPDLAALATASADVSNRGFERLLGVLERLPTPASHFLVPLSFGSWLRVLGPQQRARAAEVLVHLADAGDSAAVEVGVDLIQMWTHVDPNGIDPVVAPLALNLVSRPLSSGPRRGLYSWQQVLLLLCPFYPRHVAELVVDRITQPDVLGGAGDARNVEVLTRAAAVDPSAAMESVGAAILDRSRRAFFGVAVFGGLFESIGVRHVEAWLKRNGPEHLRWLARHFPSPYMDSSGRPVVPPITEWFFREYEADEEAFEWFLMGCDSGANRTQAEIDPLRKRQEMQPFLGHEIRRVRQWAEHEIRETEQEARFLRGLHEEDERR